MDQDGIDRQELTHSLRLVAIAIVSALMTAALVIGVGGAWLDRSGSASPHAPVEAPVHLFRTAG